MSKQPDFGNDLAALTENVDAEVGDVLQVLQQKRTASRPTVVRKIEEPTTQPIEPITENATADPVSAASPQRSKRESSRSRPAPVADREEVWKNVTTRLRLETKELLEEACLRQELKKKSPHNGQGIIDEALADWFRKHGYASGKEKENDS